MFGQDGRDYSVDLLRITSCFIVIIMHSALFMLPHHYAIYDVGSMDYYWVVLVRTVTSSPTVLFVMVSGIFSLTPTRKVTIKKIWVKNILKLTCAYILWCYIYAYYELSKLDEVINFKSLSLQALERPDHLWYIPMMISLYAIAPIFRLITKNSDIQVFKYVIIIFVIALLFQSIYYLNQLPIYDEEIKYIVSLTPASVICQYSTWFLVGYIVYTYKPSDRMRHLVYILGVISIFVAFFANYWQLNVYGFKGGSVLNEKFSICTFFKNMAIFLFFTNSLNNIKFSPKAKKVISKISGSTLIIYLMHWLVLELFFDNQIFLNLGIPAPLLIALISIVTFGICLCCSLVVDLVPWHKLWPVTLINKLAKSKV